MGHETEWFEEREDEHERCYWRRLAVEVALAVAIGICLGAVVRTAYAAPKAENAEECAMAADMALVARALAESKEPLVPAARAEVLMHRVYFVEDDKHAEAIMSSVIKTAYTIDASPLDYSKQLYSACLRGRGDMDSILGSEI